MYFGSYIYIVCYPPGPPPSKVCAFGKALRAFPKGPTGPGPSGPGPFGALGPFGAIGPSGLGPFGAIGPSGLGPFGPRVSYLNEWSHAT